MTHNSIIWAGRLKEIDAFIEGPPDGDPESDFEGEAMRALKDLRARIENMDRRLAIACEVIECVSKETGASADVREMASKTLTLIENVKRGVA